MDVDGSTATIAIQGGNKKRAGDEREELNTICRHTSIRLQHFPKRNNASKWSFGGFGSREISLFSAII